MEIRYRLSPPNGGRFISAQLSDADAYDRLTLQFDGGLPSYVSIAEASPPFLTLPLDEPVRVDGERWLRLIVSGVDLIGDGTGTFRGASRMRIDGRRIVEAVITEMFEGQVECIVGVRADPVVAVSALAQTPRITVDVADF